ncbi:MAG: DUF1540 domain-containing protein [Ruminococcus sp.]|nr:DUF1540 domain-containing protein [Ruminococcus sp.]
MSNHSLSGVSCDVENCVYHDKGHKCSAASIKVDSTCDDVCSCDETACRTFISRD